MSLRRSGRNILSYLGVEAATPPQFVMNSRRPTTRDYKEFNIGTLWLNTTRSIPPNPMPPLAEDLYMLVSKANQIATWIPFSASGLVILTGDSGGAVSPDGSDNIDVLGTAGRIVTTGTQINNTITWDIGDNVADSYVTDSGSAVPSLNILNIVGASGISTSGAGNTVTINLDDSVSTQYTTDSGNATPSSNNINVLGGTNVSTSGAGDTVTVSSSANVTTQYTTDSGIAVPVANNINIVGGIATTTSASGDTITVTAAGPNNTYFTADITAAIPNITGAGTTYQIVFNRTYSNFGSDYDTATGFYTAPSDGIYQFASTVTINNISAAMTDGEVSFVVAGTGVSVGNWSFVKNSYAATRNFNNETRYNGSIILELSSGDTVSVEVVVSNGAGDTAELGIGASGPPSRTWFSGSRVGSVT